MAFSIMLKADPARPREFRLIHSRNLVVGLGLEVLEAQEVFRL